MCWYFGRARWLIWLFAALSACPARAQFRFDSWTTENGLPNNWILALHQTRDGYLWLTTRDGVARFDGVRFRIFNKSNTPGLTTNLFSFRALWEDRAGSLWMGTEDGGVIRFRNGVFTALTTKDGLPGNHVIRIDEDASGTIWITTDAGVMTWSNGHLLRPPRALSLDSYLAAPKNMNIDGQYFGLWRLTAGGWERFAYGGWTPFPVPPDLSDPATLQIYSMAEDSEHRLWYSLINRPREYYCLSHGSITVFHGVSDTGAPQISFQDRQGRLWLSNRHGAVGFWMNGRFTRLPGIATSNIFQAFEDREGQLWIATLDHGLYRLRPQIITIYRRPDNLEANLIGPMRQDRQGVVWVRSGGLAKFEGGKFTNYYRQGHSHHPWEWAHFFSSLYEDRDGSLWTDMWDGSIVRFKDGRLHEEVTVSKRIQGRIYSILRDRSGDLWFGGVRGLYRLQGDTVTHYSEREGLPNNFVTVLSEDRGGTLWIGTKSGLVGYTAGTFSPVASLRGSEITALYQDKSGVVWIGTYYDGLSRLARGPRGLKLTRYTTEQGLYNNRAYQILEDDLGFLWMSCDLGLYRVRKQELADFAAGRIKQVTSTHFGQADGLVGQCNSEAQPMAFKAPDGWLWFATQDDIAVVEPKAIPVSHTPPPVEIEERLIDRKPLGGISGVRVRPGQSNLEIIYTALSFIKSEQIRFKYRLEGLDKDWVDAGCRRTAYYSHLPPGAYSFKVIAANSDGIWNTEGARLLISVLPPFYRTWWFVSLMVLAGAGAVVFAWQSRVSRLQRAYAAQQSFSRELIASQERERKRIAGELHDSLGQQLLIIKNWAVLALSNLDGHKTLKEPLDEISSTASHAVEEMRGISYNLRPYQLEKLGLTAAIRGLIARVAASSNIRFAGEIDNVDGLFSQEVEISIYRILQEALNNALKHSQATEGRVLVSSNSGTVDLRIEDNGRGFTPQDGGIPQQNPKGFGLLGITERVRMLGGRVVIQSAPGRGSKVQISLRTQGPA